MSPEPNSKAAAIQLHAVSRSFDEKPVVEPLTLKVEPGEFISLLGPSGCGKSTLLKLIADLDKPSSGSIEFQIRQGNRFETVASEMVSKSFVFQESALLPWRTALSNAVLPLELRGEPRESATAKAREALERVGLQEALEKYPNQLSGGMKMRVSVARALVAKPSLLLLDEPFAALDENTRYRLQEDLRLLWGETGVTTLFVTHSVSEAVFLSNRAIVFSSRPASVVTDVAIDLPQTRDKALRTSADFTSQVQQISQALERGVRA